MAALALALVGCAAPRSRPASSPSAQALKVVTTAVPITLFTRAVAGDCAQVTALIPPQTNPHDFQAKPADLVTLQQAQVLVKNGLGMEAFLDPLIAAAAHKRLRVIDSSLGVATLASAAAQPGHHDHGGVNPHIWLDPHRAMQQVERIRDGLIAADPRCQAGYQRRAATYLAALKALDQRLAQQLKPLRGKTFVAYHDMAPYFAQRYGLKGVYLVSGPDQPPSPSDMLRVSRVVDRNNIKALLSEPQQTHRAFTALARDLGVKISIFDPLETATPSQASDPKTYLIVMGQNAVNLINAIQ